MNKRTMLLGVGVGMICISILFYFVYQAEIKKLPPSAEQEALTDEEIIDRASQLGMIFYRDLPSEKDLALEKPEPTTGEAQSPEEGAGLNEDNGDPDDEGPVDENLAEVAQPEQAEIPATPLPARAPSPSPSPGLTDTRPEPSNTSSQSMITVRVPAGYTASQIANTLFQNDVIDDEQAFVQFLYEKNIVTQMPAGTFTFPAGADFEEILNIMK